MQCWYLEACCNQAPTIRAFSSRGPKVAQAYHNIYLRFFRNDLDMKINVNWIDRLLAISDLEPMEICRCSFSSNFCLSIKDQSMDSSKGAARTRLQALNTLRDLELLGPLVNWPAVLMNRSNELQLILWRKHFEKKFYRRWEDLS